MTHNITCNLLFLVLTVCHAEATLVHHYPLDETFQHEPIADLVGSLDGSSTELLRGRGGRIAGALELTEADGDHINLGPSHTVIPAGDFTVAVWVWFSLDGFDDNERLLDCSNGDAFSQMNSGFNFKTQSGALRVFVGDGVNKAHVGLSASVLSQNQWYLTVFRYRRSSSPGIQGDGLVSVTAIPFNNDELNVAGVAALTDSATHQVGSIDVATDLLAGTPPSFTGTLDQKFDGLMDDIRIYDTFLSDEEVRDLYNENIFAVSSLRWIFNVEGDKEGWAASGTSSDTVAGGDYILVSAGPDPLIESPDNLALDLTGVGKVYVKAKNGSALTTGAVYFETDADPSFMGNFVSFTLTTNDPGYTTYMVDMATHTNWTGTLKRLRIEIPQGASAGAEIRFDRIAVGESGNRPNVIVMMADDLGWRDVTVNGGDYYETPNVERLADMGMNFPNAYSANPLCSPTRAGILTGLYPARVRFNTPAGHVAAVTLDPPVFSSAAAYLPSTAVGSRTRLPNAYVTYAELMKKVGYSTAFLGKWHLGMDEYIPENQGFDFVIGGRQHPGPPGGYFAPFSADSNIPVTWPAGSPVSTDDHVNDILAAWAVDFIGENRNKPFLINMWWYDVHGPFEAKPDVRAKYVGSSSSDGRQNSPTMAAMIEVMDDGVGAVLDQLEALGLTDDTIIFFTGDNGGWMYSWIDEDLAVPTDNYPSRAGKACIWDGGSHVPFIVSWPGQVSGGTSNSNNVNNLDIYATIVDMLDLQPYDGYALDSMTLVPSLLGQAPANSNLVFNQFPQSPPATGTFPGVWVRQGDMKLIRFFHGNGGQGNHRYELYNIALDPGEENNLADGNPALVTVLDALIEQHLNDTDALQPVANPFYVPPEFDGWIPNDGVWVQNGVGGPLKMVSNSFLPALDSPDLSALPVPAKVRVTMTSRSYGNGRIWWKFPGDTEWLLAQSTGFSVTHDNVERTIEIPINPGATVAQIRYQPSSGYFETDVVDLQVLDAGDNLIESMLWLDSDGDGQLDTHETSVFRDPNDASDLGFEFNSNDDFEGWTPVANITSSMVTNGVISGLTTSPDPILQNPLFGFPGNDVPVLYMKLKASENSDIQFFWGRTGGNFFGAERRLNLSYTGAGAWQYIEIPVSTSPLAAEWNNQTITRMRIDPIALDNTTWQIDWIRATDGDRDNDTLSDAYEGFPSRDTDGDGLEDWADKDSDNDGASDRAEFEAGRDPYAAVEADLDADEDGYSDLFEMVSGTNPDDINDHFNETYGFMLEGEGSVDAAISFNSKSERTYKLLRSNTLISPNWTVATQTMVDVDGAVSFSDVTTGSSNQFYRIEVFWPY